MLSVVPLGNSRVVLRLLRPGPYEKIISLVLHCNSRYSRISIPYHDTHGSWTLRSKSLGRRLPLAMVPYLPWLHGTRPLSAVPTLY